MESVIVLDSQQYSKDPELAKLEQEARALKRGLWAVKSPTPPWEFRRAKRRNSVPSLKRNDHNTPTTIRMSEILMKTDNISILKEPALKRHRELPQKNSDAPVIFNNKSHKYHYPTCPPAARCTKNCIQIPASEAKDRGGIPCQKCGGCGYWWLSIVKMLLQI